MGYTTSFSGTVTIDPPLNAEEVSYLRDFADERHEGLTSYSYYCQWIPTRSGSELEWDGGEKFYAADEWMKYIVTQLLAPSARENVDRLAALDPDDLRLRHFTCDHVCNGVILATGEEAGDVWQLQVVNNKVMRADAAFNFPNAQEV